MVLKRSAPTDTTPNKVLITDFFGAAKNPVKKAVETEEIKINLENDDKSSQRAIETTENSEITTANKATTENSEIATATKTTSANADYANFGDHYNFNKQKWVDSLTPEERELLANEIETIDITWLTFLHKELTKPYFLQLKRFLQSQSTKTIFPPANLIYSWSSLTPLPLVKCLILGQDPYHNHNQAHGLAFSVLEPTRPPPSLVNIYKALALDFPNFEIPDYKTLVKQGTPGGGNLTKWAENGILMLNACLTVEAHKANSHAKQGWEQFTEAVIKCAIDYHKSQGFVIMAWGTPAQTRITKLKQDLSNFLLIKSVHPSPLSAHRGFFTAQVFKQCNEWLESQKKARIDWGLLENNIVT